MPDSVFLGRGVSVAAAGALSGDGSSAANPLTVEVDGVTIEINGSNDLALTRDIPAGAGAAEAGLAGALYINVTPVGNVDAGEDDLMTYTLPANTLSANTYGVRITAFGALAANGNAKTVKLYFGSYVVSTFSGTSSNIRWEATATIFRSGATSQIGTGSFQAGNALSNLPLNEPTETLSGAVVIKVTGEGVATNDIVQRFMLVEFLRAAA